MITSFIDGRIRVRARALTDPETLHGLVQLIKIQPGVLRIVPNSRIGSLLLEYDPEVLPEATLLAAVDALRARCGDTAGHGVETPCILKRETELRLLGLSAVVCAGSVLFSRRLHAGSGILFLLFAARHIFQYRRHLL
ncbi:MAG: hypothetical protein LBQ51_10510 [Desulfovibrio sp.]|jgi:hypothetical protein|nr:hypothetical protein [Desulfovibrio sp.]